jgi:hypothetical protein
MKKTGLLLLLVLGLSSISTINAQNGRFSLGPEVGIPMGDFGDFYGPAFGGSFRYEHPIGDKMGLTITAGYLVSAASSGDLGTGVDLGVIGMAPLQAGFKYYFMDQQDGFYAMANLGVHITTVAASGALESASATGLSYAPEIGYALENWDFGLRYQLFGYPTYEFSIDPVTYAVTSETSTSTESYIALRAAYVFGSR